MTTISAIPDRPSCRCSATSRRTSATSWSAGIDRPRHGRRLRQATRGAALVNLHSSAGTGHALGNLFTAFKNQTPLVITAGQQARSILPYDPFLFAERASEFPRRRQVVGRAGAGAGRAAAIARAYYIAMEPPCGPTFVSVPVDDWDQLCEPLLPRRVSARNPAIPRCSKRRRRRSPAPSAPLWCSAPESRATGWNEAIALAERHQAAVWAAPFAAREVFPENHPLFAGFLAAGRSAIVRDLDGYDVVIVVGASVPLPYRGIRPHLPAGVTLFLIVDNPSQAAWARWARPWWPTPNPP